MNTNEIWEKYAEMHGYGFDSIQVILYDQYLKSIPDILSSQWQTREPTKEDGDNKGFILVETVTGDHVIISWDAIWWTPGAKWMRIPPTQNK